MQRRVCLFDHSHTLLVVPEPLIVTRELADLAPGLLECGLGGARLLRHSRGLLH